MWTYLLIFFTAFFVVLLSTPALIRVAILKRLFDEPKEERKIHNRLIPTIGGIIIFAATLFAFALWFPFDQLHAFTQLKRSVNDFQYIVATLLILFFVGVKVDIIGTAPMKKLVAHVIVGLILVLIANIKITSFHGLFGLRDLPEWGQVFLSLSTYIVVVNAFNLIDGVDGLAAGIGLICGLAFGFWFYLAGEPVMAALAFSLAGSLLGFLIFNFSPAKLFMGDSGSLSIGLVVCVLAIRLIEYKLPLSSDDVSDTLIDFNINALPEVVTNISKPIFVMAVLFYPLFDTLRIFIYRTIRGQSPFSADRNHIHHRLIDIGMGHRGTVLSIYAVNIIVIATAVATRNIEPSYAFIIVGCVAACLAQIPFFITKVKNRNKIR
ncbi:MAG: undecaprenyl/decaprenyl-phosphate alpha-N-acetylglucosaminyl 1-phosphate transferase [Bacteroidia bacterium]|nr:undecaprenyl/decaprenyl-phosphate alpha-N-acetylglucosaminyl 1-phosphate transferase [Bacteroidia bacterium]